MNYDEIFAEYYDQIEAALLKTFDRPFDAPDNIVSAMKYSLFAGGKRLRPILMLAVCGMFDGKVEAVTALACAMEMIHTYSLIHDDLPAMDDDALRRGKPTNHMVYGEDIAILAGDALLNFAMETALSGIPEGADQIDAYLKAMRMMFRASGVNGMIGGQTGDLLCEGYARVSEAQLQYVYDHKTGALLKASILCGALIGGASEEAFESLSVYADAIGMAFQIVDDILDIRGDEKRLGKPVGSDEKNQKATFVSLYGLASASERVEDLRQTAKTALKKIDVDTGFLKDLADFICDRMN